MSNWNIVADKVVVNKIDEIHLSFAGFKHSLTMIIIKVVWVSVDVTSQGRSVHRKTFHLLFD
jgi:hypothetical protein